MENKLVEAMAQVATEKLTENGDKSYSTTKSACLDLFALGGSLRSRSEDDILHLWREAEAEDPVTAYKILFFIRSIREGYGERRAFRIIWSSLPEKTQLAFLSLVPETGRFDDLEESVLRSKEIAKIIRCILEIEYQGLKEGKSPSLLAKWLPCGKGNKTRRERTKRMAKALGYSEKEYRKRVVALRKSLNLVESKMVENRWSEIDYSKLPSLAGHKYSKAFRRHDENRYSAYLSDVLSGKAKMNAGVLTPADVLYKLTKGETEASEAEWKSLPDFTSGRSCLAMVDTSGSMYASISGKSGLTAIIASSAMGIYFAERNKGPFKGLFMTFSSNPSFVDISNEKTLADMLYKVEKADWGGSTNLYKAFRAILRLAVESKCSQADMPETLYILSDMEFDSCCKDSDKSTYEKAKEEFEKAGYTLPNVVFWNLNARNDTLPVQRNEIGVGLVSGYSPRIFKYAMEKDFDPEKLMKEILESFSISAGVESLYRKYLA